MTIKLKLYRILSKCYIMEMKKNIESIKYALIISSCDAFSDLWATHFLLLKKNWPDFHFDIFLVTDTNVNKYSFDNVTIIECGKDNEYSNRILMCLDMIKKYDYVLTTLDDYLLNSKVKDDMIYYSLNIMKQYDFDYVRMFKYPTKSLSVKLFNNIRLIKTSSRYAVNLYPALWKIETLKEVLKSANNLNAWRFEVFLSKYAKKNYIKGIMTYGKEFPFIDTVRKGKILPPAKKFLNKNGLYEGDRETMSFKAYFKLQSVSYLNRLLPRFIVKSIKKILRKKGRAFFSDEI